MIRRSVLFSMLIAFVSACEVKEPVSPPESQSPSLSTSSTPVVRDPSPRHQLDPERIISDLHDSALSDGTLLIGVKEARAIRGVGKKGTVPPVSARLQAESSILASFPHLNRLKGVVATVTPERSTDLFTVPDVIERTFFQIDGSNVLIDDILSLLNHPSVDYITPNYSYGTPNVAVTSISQEFNNWGVDSIHAPQAWALGYDGSGVPFATVDSGFDNVDFSLHPDLSSYWVYQNFTVGSLDNRCTNTDGTNFCFWEDPLHGTGVLGSAVALQNGVGSVGGAKGIGNQVIAKILYLDSNEQPRATVDDFADAILWASQNYGVPVGVTAISFRTTDDTGLDALHDAFITAYYTYDILWFAAAGTGTFVEFPGAWDEVVAVGAVDRDLNRYSNSPTGDKLELVAPGVDVRISWNRLGDNVFRPYTLDVTGTSFAAPLAAAVAKIAAEAYPGWSASGLRYELQQHAYDIGPSGPDLEFGYGLVDAQCIVEQETPCRSECTGFSC